MSTAPPSPLETLLTGAALSPLDDRAFLRITGEDRTRWLNGMVTNSVQALAHSEGNYNFLLNAQGRIQGDCTIYRDGDEFLLETSRSQVASIQQHLDRFIIMDDVELLPDMDSEAGLLLAGPFAADRLAELSLPTPPPIHLARASYSGQPVLILAPHSPMVPRFELWAGSATIAALRIALEADTAVPVPPEALEQFRLLEGTPRFGQDIRNSETARDLPQETAQDHALHFAKGCYLGQEIVERIRSRGQVHRVFSGFRLHLRRSLPSLPIALTSDGKPGGEITSAAIVQLPGGPTALALGYVRREALQRGQPLAFEGGTATPEPLPFTSI